jgi:hypothetical protein
MNPQPAYRALFEGGGVLRSRRIQRIERDSFVPHRQRHHTVPQGKSHMNRVLAPVAVAVKYNVRYNLFECEIKIEHGILWQLIRRPKRGKKPAIPGPL